MSVRVFRVRNGKLARLIVCVALLLASSTTLVTSNPAAAAVGPKASIVAGAEFSCFLSTAGNVSCWGSDVAGQSGNFGAGGVSQFAPVPVDLPAGVFATQITAGRAHACAVTSTGGIKCWGDNSFQQLGNGGPLTSRNVPPVDVVLPVGAKAIQVAAGDSHSCVIVSGGSVWCWGAADTGQIGDRQPPRGLQSVPARVAFPGGSTAVQISAGTYHTCAVLATGRVWCWGGNGSGQLGVGSIGGIQLAPVEVALPAGQAALQVSAGANHTCAVLADGGLKCWGSNGFLQLGIKDPAKADKSRPVEVFPAGSGSTSVAAGNRHTCAVVYTQQVFCWGSNIVGESGFDRNGSVVADDFVESGYQRFPLTGPKRIPFSLKVYLDASMVTVGTNHSCAVSSSAAYCWGQNVFGQLGAPVPGYPNATYTGFATWITTLSPNSAPPRMDAPEARSLSGAVAVGFNPAVDGGSAISTYTVTASPGGATATGTTSPIVVSGLTAGVAYAFTISATNAAGTSPRSLPSSAVIVQTSVTGLFKPLAVSRRLLDTRLKTPQGQPMDPFVKGRVSVDSPLDGAALNITVVYQGNDEIGGGDGFLKAWPCDQPTPNTSVLNFRRRETVANAVNVAPAVDGSVCFESSTPVNLIVDQVGSWSSALGFEGQAPERLLDTRDIGAPTTTAVVAGFDVEKATFINVTAVNAPSDGFVTVWPCDEQKPVSSNLNFLSGETRAASALVKPDNLGRVCVSSSVATHVVVDRMGTLPGMWVNTTSARRVLDTRDVVGRLPVGSSRLLGASQLSRLFNLTVADSKGDGFLSVLDPLGAVPVTSTGNFLANAASSNTAVVPALGPVGVYVPTEYEIILDLQAEIA
jgi:alpha-tubulin suppressor-like RCC1 family protein